MEKLKPVEEAKALLLIAKDWSILKWLSEKKRVRRIADTGTAALDDAERKIKSTWSELLRTAYAELATPSDDDDPFSAAERQFVQQQAKSDIPENIRATARRVKAADQEAYDARMRAERTFDGAERSLSASMARRGAEEAILAYDLRYKALEEAEKAQKLA